MRQAPTRRVVEAFTGPRCQRLEFADGTTAMVCGPPLRTERLECGHVYQTHGPHRPERRCQECRTVEAAEGRLFA